MRGTLGVARPAAAFTVAVAAELGVVIGLIVGLIGVALLALKGIVSPSVIYNPHLAWMAPVAHALWISPAAFLLGLVHRRLPSLAPPRLVVFLLLSAGFFSMLRVYGRELAEWAAVALSLGLAHRLSAWMLRPEPTNLERGLRRATVALMAMITCLVVVVGTYPTARQSVVQLGRPVPGESRPNVLLLILDTVRARSTGLHGHVPSTTPNVDRLAKQGVTFELAIAPSPWTLPSHASMFTGYFPHDLNVAWRVPLNREKPTLAEAFGRAGYRTAGVVANLYNANSAMGLARGFDLYIDYTAAWDELIRATYPGRLVLNEIERRWHVNDFGFADFAGRRTAREVTDKLLRWIDTSDQRRPFFAFANFFDAHDPYIAPAQYQIAMEAISHEARLPVRLLEEDGTLVPTSEEREREVVTQLIRYEAALAYLDASLGRLFAELEERGLLGNTLVVITSDHGEEFGGHGLYWHGHSLYLPALHVPLVMLWPGRLPEDLRVPSAVTLRDLPATILDLSGLPREALEAPFPGTSLARFWRPGDEASTGSVLSSLELDATGVERWRGSRKLESILVDGMHYIAYDGGPEELYDIRTDPAEALNLAVEGASESLRAALRAALVDHSRLQPSSPVEALQ